MATVVAAIGLFVYLHVESSLRRAVDEGLRARGVDVANLASQANNGLSAGRDPFAAPGESFGQLIDAHGRVYDATHGLRRKPLLRGAALARARRGAYFLNLATVPGGPARVFVASIHAQDQPLVLIVGTSLAKEQRALDGLRVGLLIGGPIALLLTSLAGYLLAGAALRPVERMRARAAGMSIQARGQRLPVPDANDEISRLGRTLNEMLARLERTREREQQFLADASHELRTPLTLLKTEIELALDAPRSVSELYDALRSAGEEADRLVRLTQDLLLLAQFDSDALPVRITAVDATEVAERVAARFALRAARDNRQIETEVPPQVPLRADPLRLEQALGNLIDNALRYGAGTVTVQILTAGDTVELHVRDEGSGISPKLTASAFERFSCGDPARHDPGTGLGLAIVAAIAKAHRGQAIIGEAADIYLRLPAAPIPAIPSGIKATA